MSLNVSIFEAIAPEFAGLANTNQRDLLATYAEVQVSESIWGSRYAYAVALLTAHMMSLYQSGAIAGSVQSEKVGDVQRNYAVPAQDDNSFKSTKFGLEFIRLRKQIISSPLTVC